MRIVLFLLFLMYSFNALSQSKTQIGHLKYDNVKIYDFDCGIEGNQMIVDNTGHLSKAVKKQAYLNKKTIEELNHRLIKKSSYGSAVASCFQPHLGIVYFLKHNIVAFIDICLECNRLESSFEIPAQLQGKQGKGKEIYYTGEGMSKPFRLFLNETIKKYNFSHQIKPGDEF